MRITEWTVEVIPGSEHWQKVQSVDVFESFHDACDFIDGIRKHFPDYQFNLYSDVRRSIEEIYTGL